MSQKNKYQFEKSFLNYIVHKDYYSFLKTELSKYIQHGNTSVFKHSRDVAYNSYRLSNFFKKYFNANIDNDSLIHAAYMHDMFLYDWHETTGNHKLHGFTHPKVAAQNAFNYCNASEKEQKMIKSHMWPLTITKIPTSKEAWILTMCDKYTTIIEVFTR